MELFSLVARAVARKSSVGNRNLQENGDLALHFSEDSIGKAPGRSRDANRWVNDPDLICQDKAFQRVVRWQRDMIGPWAIGASDGTDENNR